MAYISPKFQLLLVKEYQRLKAEEQKMLGWTAKRELSKINYHIHTDAIKNHLVPTEITAAQASIIYAGGLRKNWVTNWQPYSIPHSAMNCIRSSYARLLPTGRKKEHPMLSHQPYYSPSSSAKVIILFERAKSIHKFLFELSQRS